MSAPEAWHVTRTLRAMELIAVRPRSAPELADALGVHVRTARRVLKRLHFEGYVTMTEDRRRRYAPTMRVVALAGQVVERAELTGTARPYVTALREELGEGAHLSVPSYLSALCLAHDTGEHAGSCQPRLRELVPCHCTASGKALMAWRYKWSEAVLTQPLQAYTERTMIGPEALRKELGRIRARGFAIENREYDLDTRAVAAPVFDETGDAVAALGVVATCVGLPAERLGEVGAVVVRSSVALSRELGYGTAPPEEEEPAEQAQAA